MHLEGEIQAESTSRHELICSKHTDSVVLHRGEILFDTLLCGKGTYRVTSVLFLYVKA